MAGRAKRTIRKRASRSPLNPAEIADALRQTIAALNAERQRTRRIPTPSSEVASAMYAAIQQLEEQRKKFENERQNGASAIAFRNEMADWLASLSPFKRWLARQFGFPFQ